VARGHYNQETEEYDFSFSNPIVLGDLRSSRGIDEPEVVELKSGRLLMVMRGSNVRDKSWGTRIEPGTPSFKWYSYSDDGGKTFTDPEPWHFNDGEVIYSGATIGHFIRLKSDGKLYWVGNIAPHTAYGNWPRYPLYAVRIDETYGLAIKESLTVIDTREEGESERIQLSNFALLEDRETGCLEITLCRMNPIDGYKNMWGPAMRYIIDTNIFVYIAQDYSSLSREVLDIISDYSNTLHISAESVKELIVAYNNKRLFTNKWKSAEEMVAAIEDEYYVKILPLSKEHMKTYSTLSINSIDDHKDPSDHVIISHAITNKMPLISSDQRFPYYTEQGLDLIFNKR
jgi:PIN domain nuclease of toxin-antitoxin system